MPVPGQGYAVMRLLASRPPQATILTHAVRRL
jgi:hypothetical protein